MKLGIARWNDGRICAGLLLLVVSGCQAIVGEYDDLKANSNDDARDTGTETEEATDTRDDPRAVCRARGMYWYDVEDVHAEDDAAFERLRPTCHEAPDDWCPEEGEILIGRLDDGSPLMASVETEEVQASEMGVIAVYPTIRCITKMTHFYFEGNRIPTVDLMNNRFVEWVWLPYNEVLEWVGLPAGPSVRMLALNNNRISSIDLSYAENLESLHLAAGNAVETIDLENKPWLVNVELAGNRISHPLDLHASERLEYLDLAENPIGEIILPETDTLEYLDLTETGVVSIELNDFTRLRTLNVGGNGLTGLDVSGNTDLEWLSASDNQILSIDLSSNNRLNYINLYENSSLEDLAMPDDASAVEELHLSETSLSELDISGASRLKILYLENDNFSGEGPDLDFSGKPDLESISAGGNRIDYAVDLSESPELTHVDFSDNRIPRIVLAPNANALTHLELCGNELQELFLDECASLQHLDLSDNDLRYDGSDPSHRLNLTGCTDLQAVWLYGNPDYELSFQEGTFPAGYLEGTESFLSIEREKWEDNIDQEKPSWTFNDNEGGYMP